MVGSFVGVLIRDVSRFGEAVARGCGLETHAVRRTCEQQCGRVYAD
jgi:hypothetical protein